MTVYRPSVEKEYTFTLTRDEIPLYSINTSYMVDNTTGYIEIDRFSMTTSEEFTEKLSALKEQGMERLMIDLRDNPGGVMKSAIEIADQLLSSGMTIVQTRGREARMNTQYRSTGGGDFEQPPVIVLVNGNSASASEIVSGALQDHDRALIVGQRTFGKALVQRQFELTDGSLLQMTVGRYYTPVGRLIQTPYESGSREDYYSQKFSTIRDATFNLSEYRDSIPDSLAYQTDHGRTVFGGGGVLPDYVVQPDTTSLKRFITETQLDFAFVVDWFPKHEQELRAQWGEKETTYTDSYMPDDQVVEAFWSFAEEKGLELANGPEAAAPSEGVFAQERAAAADRFLRTRIKGFLARQLYGSSAMRPILNEVDPVFQEAMTLWPDAEQLSSYHASSSKPNAPGQQDMSGGD
jgi:carboxyl-terminal processing protease